MESSSEDFSSETFEMWEPMEDFSALSSDSDVTFLFFCAFASVSEAARLLPLTASTVVFGLGLALRFDAGLEALTGFAELEIGSSFSWFPCGCG